MRSALAELTAALLLTGTAPGPQRADGATVDQVVTTDQGAVVAPAPTEPVKPRPRTLREQLLDELRAAIVRQRQAATNPPVPVEAAATEVGTPPPAPSATTAPAVPMKPLVPVTAVKPTPRAVDPPPPPVDVGPAAPPAPPAVAPTAPPAPPATLVPTASAESPALAIPPVPVAAPAMTYSPWPLLVLLAAFVAATTIGIHLRRRAQIARTRAALSLNPRIDPTAGACSTSRLSFAAPPMSIEARLAHD